LHTVKRDFEYKEISEEKKVKLVAPKLRMYASLWRTNLCVKRVRKRKENIRTWEKMKSKFKSPFLSLLTIKIVTPSYIILVLAKIYPTRKKSGMAKKISSEF